MNTPTRFLTMASILCFAIVMSGTATALYASAAAGASCEPKPYNGKIIWIGHTDYSATAGGDLTDVGGSWAASGQGTLNTDLPAEGDGGSWPLKMSAHVEADSGTISVPEGTELEAHAEGVAQKPLAPPVRAVDAAYATCADPGAVNPPDLSGLKQCVKASLNLKDDVYCTLGPHLP